jgi:hypothetical protein
MSTAIALLIAGATLAISIGAIVFSAGRQSEKIVAVEKKTDAQAEVMKTLATKEQLEAVSLRSCEDRGHDNKRFEELYASRNETQTGLVELTASMQAVCDRLGRIESILDKLLERGGIR